MGRRRIARVVAVITAGFSSQAEEIAKKKCLGSMSVEGGDDFEVIAAPWSLANFSNGASDVAVPVNSRVYLGKTCDSQTHTYSRDEYSTLQLLDKTLSWTVDLSNVGCDCAATLYLVPMAQNPLPNGGGDFYCDSNDVTVKCAEFDLMEANAHAFHNTLHISIDLQGPVGGYGGGSEDKPGEGWVYWNGPRDFTKEEYGPGASCVDTTKPFRVTTEFPTDADGKLAYMKNVISQNGCSVHTQRVGVDYGTDELTAVLTAGVSPVISTWMSELKDMSWLSSEGLDGNGPCDPSMMAASTCSHSTVKDFAIGDGGDLIGHGDDDDDVAFEPGEAFCCLNGGVEGDVCGTCNVFAAHGSYCSQHEICGLCGAVWCPGAPTLHPVLHPTSSPTMSTLAPTPTPVSMPTTTPTSLPTTAPAPPPVPAPTQAPTQAPSQPPWADTNVSPQSSIGSSNENGDTGRGNKEASERKEATTSAASVSFGLTVVVITAVALVAHFTKIILPTIKGRRKNGDGDQSVANEKNLEDTPNPIHRELTEI